MTVDKAKRITENIEMLLEKESRLDERIFKDFFSKHPEVTELFSEHTATSRKQMVRETLVYAIDFLEEAPWVHSNLQSRGGEHREYEVTPSMYGWFNDSMINTFASLSGEAWSIELEKDWRYVLEQLSGLMRGD